MRITNQLESKGEARLGRYTIRTWWSGHGTQLVSAVSLRTKDLHDAQIFGIAVGLLRNKPASPVSLHSINLLAFAFRSVSLETVSLKMTGLFLSFYF
jgi:hypothetical protein